RTVFSALSGMRLLACLIVAPQRGYDEPTILSYAISSFCPTSADGLQAGGGSWSSLLLEQTSEFTFSTQSTPIAPPAISISVLPSNRNMAQSRLRLQPTPPTSEGKTSATGAISIRFEASKLITSQPRNTSAAIHSSYSFSSPADLPGKFIST